MRLKRFQLNGHPVLGDLDLDFTDENGGVFDTVVFAGANGSGKTVMLDTIQKLFEWQFPTDIGSARAEIILDDSNQAEFEQLISLVAVQNIDDFVVEYQPNPQGIQADDVYRLTWTNEAGAGRIAGGTNYHVFRRDYRAKSLFRSFFSQTQINFSVGEINTITSTRLDEPDRPAVRTSPNLAREIAQLLVDIRAADAEDLQRWVEANPNQAPPLEIQSRRLSRFTRAFEVMFPTKRLKRVD
jgi:hypothetical protein